MKNKIFIKVNYKLLSELSALIFSINHDLKNDELRPINISMQAGNNVLSYKNMIKYDDLPREDVVKAYALIKNIIEESDILPREL